jgi:hypothetical protein
MYMISRFQTTTWMIEDDIRRMMLMMVTMDTSTLRTGAVGSFAGVTG